MQTFRYPHLPTELSAVHVALFANVTNSADIRSCIVRASQLEGPDGEAEEDVLLCARGDSRGRKRSGKGWKDKLSAYMELGSNGHTTKNSFAKTKPRL